MSRNRNRRNHNNGDANNCINESVKKLSKVGADLEGRYKKFKKKHKDDYDNKKEMKEAFFDAILELLPEGLEFIFKFGYVNKPEVKEAKNNILKILVNDDFLKVLKKEIKKDSDIENIKLLPVISKEIFTTVARANEEVKAKEGENAKLWNVDILVEINKMILGKKIKKMVKKGIDEDLAFDLLLIIPDEKVLKNRGSVGYRANKVFETMYEHAKGKVVPIETCIDALVSEDYYSVFILTALLERKERYGNLTENQKALYAEITKWVFDTMEQMNRDTIEEIICSYVKKRKGDAANQKDGARRYTLTSLSETDYPKTAKTIARLIADDDSMKQYL